MFKSMIDLYGENSTLRSSTGSSEAFKILGMKNICYFLENVLGMKTLSGW